MLNAPEREVLKARPHTHDPVVLIGAKGLTDVVVKEIDLALKSHELIKVRAATLDRDAREAALREICSRTGAQVVQAVGKIFVLYRKKPEAE